MKSLNLITIILVLSFPILPTQAENIDQDSDNITPEADFLYDTEPFDETALPATLDESELIVHDAQKKETPDENALAVDPPSTLSTQDDYEYDDSTFFTEVEPQEDSSSSDLDQGISSLSSEEDSTPSNQKNSMTQSVQISAESATSEKSLAVSPRSDQTSLHSEADQITQAEKQNTSSETNGYFSRTARKISDWFSR